jgi:hypothetical protein
MTVAELTIQMNELETAYQSDEGQAFQRLLELDLASLSELRQIEQKWEQALRTGAPFNFEFDRELTRRYQKWVTRASSRLKQLQIQEEKGCHPESAGVFRQQLEEVEEHLLERTQDEQSALAALQDLR